MAEIIAHAPDGATLHFPEGTSPDVIDRVIKQRLNQNSNSGASGAPTWADLARDEAKNAPSQEQLQKESALRMQPSMNPIVDIANPILSTMAGTAAGAAYPPAAPITGPGVYALTHMLLEKLKSTPENGVIANAAGLTPGSLSSGATNAFSDLALGKVVDTGITVGKGLLGKLANDADIMKYLPTTSQAMRMKNGPSKLASLAKFMEDTFSPGAKAAAQNESGAAAQQIGNQMAAKMAGRSVSTISNPNTMIQLTTGEMVPAEEYGSSKILQRTATVQPISFLKNPLLPPEVPEDVLAANGFGGQSIPPKLAVAPTQTMAGAGTKEVPIPGAYEILPGVVKKVPFATDPIELYANIKDPSKLQKMLTDSQAAGLGVNVRQDLGSFNFKTNLDAATTKLANGTVRVDPDKFRDLMFPTNGLMTSSNDILYSKTAQSNIMQFVKNIAETQAKSGSPWQVNGARMIFGGSAITLPLSFLRSALLGSTTGMVGAAGIGGIEVGLNQVGRLLSNPKTARIMLALADGSALGVSDQLAARAIVKGLSRATVNVVNGDGTKEPATIQNDQLVPVGQ